MKIFTKPCLNLQFVQQAAAELPVFPIGQQSAAHKVQTLSGQLSRLPSVMPLTKRAAPVRLRSNTELI